MRFAFKSFDEMTPRDYEAVGLRAGLEIHQQLLTKRKLFCRCPAGRYSDEYDAEILRHMRPTLSELGEYDGTALMEFKTKKEIIYRIHSDTVCTYEMDDTPPFMMDETALDIALEAALLLNLNLVNELHIARKQYLDGSIPTGFQRTTILGVDGWIPFKDRRIRIRQLGLEEDACREVSDVGHQRVYLTDRLGMPLIEPVTYPDMHTPQEVAEVGEILRRLLRATGKVRTGYGAARQDVNVSVEGGTRIEIKGVPRIPRIPLLVYNEALRQWSLLGIREILAERGITPATFKANAYDVTRVLQRTHFQPIQKALERGERVRCVKLHGFAGILNEKTQTDTNFSREISDRVRVIACLTRLPNISHSDSATEALSAADWKHVRQRTGSSPEDALVLVWGNEEDVETACREIEIRAREATMGVPSETRQALRDGTTGFERILPGPDRMYPDTDLPPKALAEERVARIRALLPEPPWEREARYEELGLSPDVLSDLAISRRAPLFERLITELEVQPKLAGEVLVRYARALRRWSLEMNLLSDALLFAVFKALSEERFAREGLWKVLALLISKEQAAAAAGAPGTTEEAASREAVRQTLAALGIEPVNEATVQKRIAAVLEETQRRKFESEERRHRSLMGHLMKDLLGRADGRGIAGLLRDAMN